jgi:hypothetical protein
LGNGNDDNTFKTRQKNKKHLFPTPFPETRKKLDQISLSKTVSPFFSWPNTPTKELGYL